MQELADKMREADRSEVQMLSRMPVGEAVQRSFVMSDHPVAVREIESGALVCVFGFSPLAAVSAMGAPWLLGTDRLFWHPKTLVRRSRAVIKCVMDHRYDRLTNVVWAGNTRSIRYLQAVGFEMGPVETTFFGVPYRRFDMERAHV